MESMLPRRSKNLPNIVAMLRIFSDLQQLRRGVPFIHFQQFKVYLEIYTQNCAMSKTPFLAVSGHLRRMLSLVRPLHDDPSSLPYQYRLIYRSGWLEKQGRTPDSISLVWHCGWAGAVMQDYLVISRDRRKDRPTEYRASRCVRLKMPVLVKYFHLVETQVE